jgi:hypothetical protein
MRTITTLVACSLLATACVASSDDSDDNDPDTIDNVSGKTDGNYPGGVYKSDSDAHDGSVGSVTLSMDKTFSRTLKVAACPQLDAGCANSAGTYTFSHSSSTHYIRFLDSSGTLIDRYAWKLSGETLSLRATGDTTWYKLENLETTKLHSGDTCADAEGNSLGECPEDQELYGEYNGPDADAPQQCLPPI